MPAATASSTSAPSTRSSAIPSTSSACATCRPGKLKSLVWPTFFDHTAREGEYFVQRLARLSAGDPSLGPGRTAVIWTLIMGEHAEVGRGSWRERVGKNG